MRNEYRSVALLGAAAAVVVAAAFGSPAAARDIKLAHLAPTDDTRHTSLLEFAKAVEERTKGEIKIRIYPNSTLGSDREVIEQQKGGLTELALNGEVVSNFYSKWSVINLPYMWRDQEHIEKFLQSDLARQWEKETAAAAGLQILGYYARSPRILVTRNKPVKSIADLQGLKIRVPQIDVYMDTWRAFGVQPTPMATSEFMLALKTGTVDGMENPIELMYQWKIYEIAKYLSYTEHMQTRLFLSASKKFFDSLPDDQKKILVEEAQKSQKAHFQRIINLHDEMEKGLLAKGMIIEKKPDISGFKEKVKPVHEKYMNLIGRDAYEAILKM